MTKDLGDRQVAFDTTTWENSQDEFVNPFEFEIGAPRRNEETSTYIENESIADIIAKRDAIGLKLSVLRSFVNTASEKIDRYSNKEIKILSTVNVAEKQAEVDSLSKEYRLIDTKLQGLNWTTDLLE